MKKLLLILVLSSLPILTMGQEISTTVSSEITIDKKVRNAVKTEAVKQDTKTDSAIKTQLLKINRKKSNEIISIKAYRKSLQIKVKTVKLC